jgi:hypothetical protein
MAYLWARARQPPYYAPRYSATSPRPMSLSGNLNGSGDACAQYSTQGDFAHPPSPSSASAATAFRFSADVSVHRSPPVILQPRRPLNAEFVKIKQNHQVHLLNVRLMMKFAREIMWRRLPFCIVSLHRLIGGETIRTPGVIRARRSVQACGGAVERRCSTFHFGLSQDGCCARPAGQFERRE